MALRVGAHLLLILKKLVGCKIINHFRKGKLMNQQNLSTIQKPIQILNIKELIKKLDFEFMDLNFLPKSLRSTLRDILEVGNSAPFRNYYQWTSNGVYEYAQKHHLSEIIELGAGCAPITRHLIKQYPEWTATFRVTDLNPDKVTFQKLEKLDQRVTALYKPLDFTKKIKGFENSLLVLSATFHHVDEKQKSNILSSLKSLSPHIMIFEPLRPTTASLLFVIGALVSGFLTPFFRLNSMKFFRSFFWCWVVPIAPFLFLWDGWISSIRCWSKQEWLAKEPKSKVEESLFCTKVVLG